MPTIMNNVGSRWFVIFFCVGLMISYYGYYRKTLGDGWDWRLFRTTAKYELQTLRRGLYVMTNSDEWQQLTPKLSAFRIATHQIERIQILVSKVRNGLVFRGMENISGRRFITRVDSDSQNSVCVKTKSHMVDTTNNLNKELYLTYGPQMLHEIYVRSNDRPNKFLETSQYRLPYTILIIVDTV